MRKCCLVLLFLVANQFAYSQPAATDSLLRLLSTNKEDTSKVNILNNVAKKYQLTGDYTLATSAAREALTISEKINYKKGILYARNNLGSINMYQGDYPEALNNFFVSLQIAEESGNNKGLTIANGNIGIIYAQQNNYSEALKYYQTALAAGKKINDKLGIANIYGNIGYIYSQQNNDTAALRNYQEALSISEENGYKLVASNAHNNIAIIYFHQGRYEESLKSHFASLKIAEETGDKYGMASSFVNLGGLYIRLNKYADAKKYLDNALKISSEIGSKDIIRDAYLAQSRLDSALGDFTSFYKHHSLYDAMKDSILNEATNTEISRLKIQYETEKKDKEISIKSIKIEQQKTLIRNIILGFVAVILFALIYFRLYFDRKKTAFQHQVLETEMKALRSQMNPHFTFNVLNSIQYYAGSNDMDSVQLYLHKFSTLIRMILDQSRVSYISLQQEISMLKLYLELEEMRFEKKFNYTITTAPDLDTFRILIPGMLIQPIVENAIKHGIEHKKGSALIQVAFYTQDSTLVCTITDNGLGRSASEQLRKGKKSNYQSAGTAILKERMEALSSLYNIELAYRTVDLFDADARPSGTKVTMEIPLNISPT